MLEDCLAQVVALSTAAKFERWIPQEYVAKRMPRRATGMRPEAVPNKSTSRTSDPRCDESRVTKEVFGVEAPLFRDCIEVRVEGVPQHSRIRTFNASLDVERILVARKPERENRLDKGGEQGALRADGCA